MLRGPGLNDNWTFINNDVQNRIALALLLPPFSSKKILQCYQAKFVENNQALTLLFWLKEFGNFSNESRSHLRLKFDRPSKASILDHNPLLCNLTDYKELKDFLGKTTEEFCTQLCTSQWQNGSFLAPVSFVMRNVCFRAISDLKMKELFSYVSRSGTFKHGEAVSTPKSWLAEVVASFPESVLPGIKL